MSPPKARPTGAKYLSNSRCASPEAKARLAPLMDDGNRDKTINAPVTVVVAHDLDFHEKLPVLFPHTDAKSWFDGPRENRELPAFRNGTLQGAYLIMAARALGLEGVIGTLAVGSEADFVVLNPAATPLLARKSARASSLDELLFGLIVLGDDRVVERVVIA